MKMTCEDLGENVLVDLITGRLEEASAKEALRHLETCRACGERLEQLQGLLDTLKDLDPAAGVESGLGVGGQILAEVKSEFGAAGASSTTRRRRAASARVSRARRRRTVRAVWLAPLAAAAAVVLAVALLYEGPSAERIPAVADAQGAIEQQQPRRVEPLEERPAQTSEPVPEVDTRIAVPETPEEPERFELVEALPVHRPTPIPAERQTPEEPEVVVEKPVETPGQPKAETARPVGRLVLTEGNVYYRRAGSERTFRATEGIHFSAGDEFDTRFGKARVELADGAVVFCNRKTVFTFDEGRLGLRDGELYCDVKDAERLDVVTADGAVRHIGTKFLVKVRSSGTTVVVEEGRVEVSNEKGKVALEAGWQVSVRKGREPARPRKADVKSALAWVKTVRREVQLFADDFNRSPLNQWPAGWDKHETDAASRSHFMVEEGGEQQTGRYITCRGQAGGTTQHAFLPVPRWGAEFTVSFRFRLSGAVNKRAGIEFYDEGDHQHPELAYDAGSGRLEARERRPSVRSLKSVPLTLHPGTWYLWEVSFSGRRCSVGIDGKAVLECEFQRAGSARKASLVSSGSDSAEYDDVKATGFVGGAGR